MADEPTDYRPYAGRVLFPRTPADLTATDRCPACQATLERSICDSCGLDLRHPAASELYATSQRAAAALDRRLELIGQIRYETHAVAAADASAIVDAAIAEPVAVTPETVVATPVPPAIVLAPAATPGPLPQNPPDEHRRSGIQVLLVVVGISLLSIAAIFFLVYAFITWGLLARSIIIGAITVGAIVGASALHRRQLPATAEGVAIFAIVLLYLDAFAIRGNDLLGAGATDAVAYWGWTLIITAIAFVAWSRLTMLRTPGLVGFATLAPGVGLVAIALSETDAATTVFVFAAAVALASAVHRLAPRLLARPAIAERVIAVTLSALGLLTAAITAYVVAPDARWGATIALLIVTAIAAFQVVLLDWRSTSGSTSPTTPTPIRTPVGTAIVVIGAVTLTSVLPVGIFRSLDPTAIIVFPMLIGAVITLVLEALARVARGSAAATHSVAATIAAAVTTAVFATPPLSALGLAVLTPPVVGLSASWTLSPTDSIDSILGAYDGAALATVAGAGLLVAGAWWFGGAIRHRLVALAFAGCAILVLAVALLPSLWLMLTGWEALAFAAVIAVTVTDVRGRLSPGIRVALLSTAFVASGLAYATSWASMDTWQLVTLAVIVVLLTARLFFPDAVKALLLGIAVSLFVVMGAAGARDLAVPLHPTVLADAVNTFRATGFVGILLLGLVALLRVPALRALDRRVVFWIAAVVITGSTIVSQVALLYSVPRDAPGRLLPEHAASAAVSVFLIASLLCWAMARAPRRFPLERMITVGALPLALYWFVDSSVRALGADDSLIALAPAAAAVIGAAASLAIVGTAAARSLPRLALDAGVAIVGAIALITPAVIDSDSEWVALIITAVTVLLLAISRDGLFASTSPRKHLGWLALVLATVGLWSGLASGDVRSVEPYVLPVAGALLAIAALAELFSPGRTSLQLPAIVLGALLLAIVPVAAVGASGPIARPIVVGALSAALLIAASFVRVPGRGRRYLDAVAIAGTVGVIIVTATRVSGILLDDSTADARLEARLVPGIAALAIAAVGQARLPDESPSARGIIAQAALALALLGAALFELPALYPDAGGFARAATLTVLLCATFVVSIVRSRPPFTVPVAWLAFVLAVLVSVTALARGAFGELELTTVPLAAALIAVGGIHLSRTSSARTWTTLAPGVALLLVPSLIATAVDAPLWRLVGLGVVSIVVLVISLRLRLQAPLLIAAVVLLIHAIGTFAPQIVAVYQAVQWWLWLAIGGAIVLTISIRFESSRRGLKAVIGRIAALR